MKGLELSRAYYEQVGRPALERELPELTGRMAIGLAGEGSECFGFDDELSRDHDWGPAFCIWLEEEDYLCYGARVQQVYEGIPGEFEGFPARKDGPLSGGRVGCLPREGWYTRFTGFPEGPQELEQWRRIPESFLATATNGAVFSDPLGKFSAVREKLLAFYPEDVRIKKIVARAAVMAQAGQYNYPRLMQRGEPVAAQLALAEFSKAAMSMAYLLSRRYAPYYKWMHRGLKELPVLPRLGEQLEWLSQLHGRAAAELVEAACLDVVEELRNQGLTDRNDSFLADHCPGMMEHIQDPLLRRAHIMEE